MCPGKGANYSHKFQTDFLNNQIQVMHPCTPLSILAKLNLCLFNSLLCGNAMNSMIDPVKKNPIDGLGSDSVQSSECHWLGPGRRMDTLR